MESSAKPETPSRMVPAIVTGITVLWTAGVVIVPWLISHDVLLGHWLRWLYRSGCHQITDRCLDLGFGPLAVCARCAGLYLGGSLALLWTTLRNRPGRPRPIWLAVVAAPTVIDFAAGQLGLPSMGNWARFFVALPLGSVAGLFFGDALLEIVRVNSRRLVSDNSDRDSLG
jgi:uncharacterized membrane protein